MIEVMLNPAEVFLVGFLAGVLVTFVLFMIFGD